MAATASGLAFSTIGVEGVNLAQTQSPSSTTPEYPGPSFSLGQKVIAVDGSEYIFALAPSTVTLGQVGYLDTSWNFTPLTSTNAAGVSGQLVAVASQVGIPATNYGWVQTKGLCPAILGAASTGANAQLYTSATAGQITTTSGGNVALNGIILTTAVGGGGAATAVGLLNGPEVLLTT